LVGSVGTDHHPFPRLLEWVAAAQRELGVSALVQRGATDARVGLDGLETVDYMAADELEARMAAAAAVVCHGGPGTMSLAIRCGHRPIVIARDPRLGEHVDDHQQRYTARLAAEGSIDTPTTVDQMIDLVRQALVRPRTVGPQADQLNEAIARFTALMSDFEQGRVPRRRWRDRLLIRRTP
jgi:UDP-N-acetylglucosamine transferase subunit ALG13